MSGRLAAVALATIGVSFSVACDADLTEPESSPPDVSIDAHLVPGVPEGIPPTVYGRLRGVGQIREGQWKIGFYGWARGNAAHAPNQWSDYRWEGSRARGRWVVRFHNVSVPEVSGGTFRSRDFNLIMFGRSLDPAPPCVSAGGIEATGRFKGEPGWVLSFFFSDIGHAPGSGMADRVTLSLRDPSGAWVYNAVDTDFPSEGACLGPARTELDRGNLSSRFR